MTRRQAEDYLQDMLDAIVAIEQFTARIEFEAFSQNLEKVFAVSSFKFSVQGYGRCWSLRSNANLEFLPCGKTASRLIEVIMG